MNAVDRSPARLSSLLAVLAALVAVVATGSYSWLALQVGAVGMLVHAVGVLVGSRAAVSVGAAGLFAAAVAAGVQGGPVVVVLVGATTAILAWDAGESAIAVGQQLGRAAPTARGEVVHLAATALVGVLAAGIGGGIYLSAGSGYPLATLVFLLLAAVLIASALR